jgi:hypothetical protein
MVNVHRRCLNSIDHSQRGGSESRISSIRISTISELQGWLWRVVTILTLCSVPNTSLKPTVAIVVSGSAESTNSINESRKKSAFQIRSAVAFAFLHLYVLSDISNFYHKGSTSLRRRRSRRQHPIYKVRSWDHRFKLTATAATLT